MTSPARECDMLTTVPDVVHFIDPRPAARHILEYIFLHEPHRAEAVHSRQFAVFRQAEHERVVPHAVHGRWYGLTRAACFDRAVRLRTNHMRAGSVRARRRG